MQPSDMTDIPPDLGSAIHMIGRLRAEVKRRPKLAVIKVDTPQDTLYADRLHVVQPDQKVTITLEKTTEHRHDPQRNRRPSAVC